MTHRLLWLGSVLVLVGCLEAAPGKLGTLQVGSRTYHDVTVLGANATDLYFTHAQGIANVKLRYLTPELQREFRYDSVAAAEAERQRAEDEARFAQALAQNVAAEAARKSPAAEAARAWAELGLSDALGDGSWLNRPAPEVAVEKWLGEKPETKGRLVVVLFWASWSTASRAVLPQFNAWHKLHADKLVIIGIAPDAERELSQLGDQRPEFFSAIDTKNRLATSVGVRTLPYCLLIDSASIVRYQGHPAALDPKKLPAILARGAE